MRVMRVMAGNFPAAYIYMSFSDTFSTLVETLPAIPRITRKEF